MCKACSRRDAVPSAGGKQHDDGEGRPPPRDAACCIIMGFPSGRRLHGCTRWHALRISNAARPRHHRHERSRRHPGRLRRRTASGRAPPERAGEPHGHRAAGVLRRKKTRVRRALGTRRHPVPAGRVARAGTHPLRGDAHHRRRRRPSGQAVVVPRGGQRRAQEPAGGARARSPHRRSGRRAPRRERTAARRAAGLGARERGRRQLPSPPLPASRPIPERRLPA